MPEAARWTVLVYMAGDNDLSEAAARDLQEMRAVGSTAALNIVAEVDRAGDEGTRRIRVGRDGEGELVESLGETDSGSPETLDAFLAWAEERFPAERTALVLWNHGGGWQPEELDRIARDVGAPAGAPGEAAERAASSLGGAFFRSTLETVLRLPTPEERAICSDDGSGHSLDMVELDRVLGQAAARRGRPFDLLGMDACLMSSFEVAYQVAPHARWLVASEEIAPNEGWPYARVLAHLAAEPGLGAEAWATHIVEDYVRSYEEAGHGAPVTLAALDLGRLDGVAASLDRLAEALIARLPGAAQAIWDAQRRSARFQANTLWDIAELCAVLGEGADAELAAACADLRALLAPGEGRAVRAFGARGDKVARCGGVSVYLLPKLLELSRYYGETRFARAHRWPAMLEAYHAD